jgi:hypothetical protein
MRLLKDGSEHNARPLWLAGEQQSHSQDEDHRFQGHSNILEGLDCRWRRERREASGYLRQDGKEEQERGDGGQHRGATTRRKRKMSARILMASAEKMETSPIFPSR